MEEDEIANFVSAYLKKKGLKEAEQAFLKKLKLSKTNSSSSPSIHLDCSKHLLTITENKMCGRNEKWEESSEGESNYEMHDLDSNDEEECYYASELAPKLQFRFLMEIGAVTLINACKDGISLKDLYGKIAGGKIGCPWEQFEVYKHLKSLGYIVGRHGVPWSLKKVKNSGDSIATQSSGDKTGVLVQESEDIYSINLMFNEMWIGETRPMSEAYLPNSKFRKSAPGNPSFIIWFAREHPPCKEEIEELERKCGSVPLKFSTFEHGEFPYLHLMRPEKPE